MSRDHAHAPARGTGEREPLSRLRLSAYAVTFVVLGQQTTWQLGDLAFTLAVDRSTGDWVAPSVALALLFVGLLLAGFFWWRRRPTPRERRRLAAAMAVALVAGFVVMQTLVSTLLPVAPFHGFFTWRGRSRVERSSLRPRITYELSSPGFRGPEWGPRLPGTTRIALVGDSYVFGSGVEASDTLDRALAARLQQIAPARRFEVLNLGVPGDNIASHVKLFAIAVEHLDASSVVICLTLPNDLSRIEPPEELRALMRPSVTGLAMYLFGSSWVRLVSDLASLESAVSEAGLAWLDRQLAEIARIHAEHPRTSVFLFAFRTPDPRVLTTVARHPEIPLIPIAPEQDDDRNYIPLDGHPNAEGNRLFAGRIAPIVAAAPSE